MKPAENDLVLENRRIKVVVEKNMMDGKEEFYTKEILIRSGKKWESVFSGVAGHEFCTSFMNMGVQMCETVADEEGNGLKLSAGNEIWKAEEEIILESGGNTVIRKQKYRFLSPCEGYINPGYMVNNDYRYRYTYPLMAYQKYFKYLPPMRRDSAWAVPLPCHILSTDQWVAVYGIDRNAGAGTLDYQSQNENGYVRLGTYYPDTAMQSAGRNGKCHFTAGQEITIVEFISVKQLEEEDIPIFEGEKLAAELLLKDPLPTINWVDCADRIAGFFERGSLWEPDAFGSGRGWFHNMWTYTTGKTPKKDSFFELGWGEGYGVLTMNALARNWKRTGNPRLLNYLDEMTEGMDCFGRDSKEPGMYYDRFFPPHSRKLFGAEVQGFNDFNGYKKIWSHSLGNIGYQLLDLYRTVPQYPKPEIRKRWLDTGMAIGEFIARHQLDNGDIQDGFREDLSEASLKPYRIPARAVVCGLWSIMAEISGDASYLQRARKLAQAISKDIERFDFYGQMIDSHGEDNDTNNTDAENACYALLGLTELYLATSDEKVNRLCKLSATYIFSWTYFYNLPNGYKGWTRGGTTCKMPGIPLLYVGAGALAFIPLIRLAEKTGELFYKKMAEEILECISIYQWECPDKPWDGGIVHALDQRSGEHWGPEKLGQVDSGMTTGMALADLEYWIENNRAKD